MIDSCQSTSHNTAASRAFPSSARHSVVIDSLCEPPLVLALLVGRICCQLIDHVTQRDRQTHTVGGAPCCRQCPSCERLSRRADDVTQYPVDTQPRPTESYPARPDACRTPRDSEPDTNTTVIQPLTTSHDHVDDDMTLRDNSTGADPAFLEGKRRFGENMARMERKSIMGV